MIDTSAAPPFPRWSVDASIGLFAMPEGGIRTRRWTLPRCLLPEPTSFVRSWLPFLDTHRTHCVAPGPEWMRLLKEIRSPTL